MWVDRCLGVVLTLTNLLLMINPLASIRNYEKSIKIKSNHSLKLLDPNRSLTKQHINYGLSFCHSSNPSSNNYSTMHSLRPNMVMCHVVDVHMTPLRESQHTYHPSIKHMSNSHDQLQHGFSHDLKNKSNYSQMIIMLKIRGVLNSTMDLNI